MCNTAVQQYAQVCVAHPGALDEADAEPEGLPEDLDNVEGEDTGLGQLARRVAAEAMEGADGDACPAGQSTAAEAPELQHLKVSNQQWAEQKSGNCNVKLSRSHLEGLLRRPWEVLRVSPFRPGSRCRAA